MRKPDSDDSAHRGAIAHDDLGTRVARYRARLIAEGRMNSVKQLDHSVAESASKDTAGKPPR